MKTNRFIIKTNEFEPIKDVVDNRVYLSASFATSSCNWEGYIYCDVTIPNPELQVSIHKWMVVTGSVCHFITAI